MSKDDLNNTDLQESIERLKEELSQLRSLDSTKQKTVEDLLARLTELAEAPEDQDRSDSFNQLLSESVSSFETSHPTITAAMQQVLSLLGSIGI